MLTGEKILITGATSQVGLPIAAALATGNDVWGIGRFGSAADRAALEAVGGRCIVADFAASSFDHVPDDFTYVLNFAVGKSGDANFDRDLAVNVEAVGRLMYRCRAAKAFLHCSSTAVYAPAGHHLLAETDPLGDNHQRILPTYSICKIAAEAMVRFGARQWNLPATIARLNVPYGANGGWPAMHFAWMRSGSPIPVHPEQGNLFNPLHEDDYIAHVPRLLEIARVPAVTLNWAGSEQASIEDWCTYMGELAGIEPKFLPTEYTIGSVTTDLTRMHELLGRTRVHWRDGMRRMIQARHPEIPLRG